MNSSDTGPTYDYIVVGAGSAGCVLANRLSAQPDTTVLLLEAGRDTEPFWVRTPAGMAMSYFDERINWKFSTEPEPNLANRRVYWPRGKLLGGTSAINGMVYVRGFASDYDNWAAAGNKGWGWKDVLPYFKRAETSDSGADEYRGKSGPLRVSFPHSTHPATDRFIAASVAVGAPRNKDLAGVMQDGVGYVQHTIGDGIRSSTARAYIKPVRGRTNLTIAGEALVERVRIESGRATGVEYRRHGLGQFARARREVILSAGAIGSPHLLMLSGVGSPQLLHSAGVSPVHTLPGVGANLQDHLSIPATYELRKGFSQNHAISGWRKYLHGAAYLINRRGPLAMGGSHAQAFLKSDPSVTEPDIQLSFRPTSFVFDKNNVLKTHPFPGVQFGGVILRPHSRGHISLGSPDPAAPPTIHANYLSAPEDERVILATVKWIRRIMATPPMADIVVREDGPGDQFRTDSEIMDVVRRTTQSIYHPVGTCKMGNDSSCVVDARLKVHGIGSLRVVDASVMPDIVSGNTNAPTIMIAEKASDLILEDGRR